MPDVLLAPAKLTLSLRVVGRRRDGFHLIDAEMVTLDLADRLEIRDGAEEPSLEQYGSDGERMTEVEGPANLVMRALALVGRSAEVRLDKAIPAGAGLGGGSADAAAVLRWAGSLDLEAAATLGADVPFCVVGGRARVRGIGEVVEPLRPEPRTYTLLTPPFGCSTPTVYAAWDRLGGPEGPNGNDLEPAALAVEPRLERYRDILAELTGEQPRLAGSGSTWFVEGPHAGPGRTVVRSVA